MSEDVSVERLSVGEAARALGVTRDAIHKRISRGTIQYERDDNGRYYVYVDTSTASSKEESKVEALEWMLEHQQDRISFLERELERKDAILLNMTEAMKALSPPPQEAPSETRESPQTVDEQQGRGEPHSDAPSAQEDAQRPWWRRLFRG